MLQLVEEALDEVAVAVGRGLDRALELAVAAGRDVGPSAGRCDAVDDGAGVVAAIGDESLTRPQLKSFEYRA
jgi:hypothetical protein